MDRMFEPFAVGSLSLRNRFVLAPVKTAFGTPDGRVTRRQELFYESISQDGPALVILEPAAVMANGREHPKQFGIHHPYSADEARKLTTIIRSNGAHPVLHLNHAGAAANPKVIGCRPMGPSACLCPSRGNVTRAMGPGDIEEVIGAFGEAAGKAEAGGFSAVEIQAGHGYLLFQFGHPSCNVRDDAFGKDLLLFSHRVFEAVRSGTNLPVILRISMRAPDDLREAARLKSLLALAGEVGISAVHVGMGDACFAPPWYYHHGSLPEEPQEKVLSLVRRATALPVIAAGRMGDRKRIERLLNEGLMDMVALGRPLVADPNLISKWKRHRDAEITHCGYCLQGCLANVIKGEGLSCIVNPEVGREELRKTASPVKVLVAGGGPAGLSAALFTRLRGHDVTLAEAGESLGGTFRAAPLSPGKEAMARPLEGLVGRVSASGANVLMNRRVDSEFVSEFNPDVLIWAVGGEPSIPPISGLDRQPRLTSSNYYLEGKHLEGERVLVLGGGMVGVEAAEKLALEGKDVTIVEMLDELAGDMLPVTRKLCLKRLRAMANVKVLTSTVVIEFKEGEVLLEEKEKSIRLPSFDWIFIATGLRSRPGPAESLMKKVKKVITIGDAKEVADIYAATQAGYRAAMEV